MLGIVVLCLSFNSAVARRANILYLMADDMRTDIGAYGHEFVRTPHLDALASSGMRFDRAFSNFAYCAPSRNSFLSGRRPDRTRALNFRTTFREAPGGQDWVTMPQWFKEQGYFTSSAGKLYHDGQDDPASWSYPSNQTSWHLCSAAGGDGMGPDRAVNPMDKPNFCTVTPQSRQQHTDEEVIVAEGLKRLHLASASGRPWFVGVGVHRPHWPWRLPESFNASRLYPGLPASVAPPRFSLPPRGQPWQAGNFQGEDVRDAAIGCGATCNRSVAVPPERASVYRAWYYAAVSYVDHMMGQVLRELEALGHANDTIVIFHSDHGWQLGEMNEWSKKTNTELATQVPLMIRVPWLPASHGQASDGFVELIDLYRTMVDLATDGEGNEDVQASVQGSSKASLLRESAPGPRSSRPSPRITSASAGVGVPTVSQSQDGLEDAAFSQIARCGCYDSKVSSKRGTECNHDACAAIPQTKFDFMGYTLRTRDWRFAAWPRWDRTALDVDWSSVRVPEDVELYNVSSVTGTGASAFDDPSYSVRSCAADPEHSGVVHRLLEVLQNAQRTWR
eukprot:TRINITY_DN3376_c0_g2_i1.p1 TRINITY_DN3376_c0_g2~~TRINITY_DN3376_c0_g2_i1.p1  ORF type:complete len:562 (+),score=84.73 TRINITY_DN3376_c0_g2_i1:237-1922(+)